MGQSTVCATSCIYHVVLLAIPDHPRARAEEEGVAEEAIMILNRQQALRKDRV